MSKAPARNRLFKINGHRVQARPLRAGTFYHYVCTRCRQDRETVNAFRAFTCTPQMSKQP